MPKINPTQQDNQAFLADVQHCITRANNKAKRLHLSLSEKQDPKRYWKEQQRRMHDPKCKSFDAITPYMVQL